MDEEKTTIIEKEEEKEQPVQKTKKTPWGIIIAVIVVIAALVVLGYLLFLKPKPLDEAAAKIQEMQELTQKIQGLETDMKKKQDDMFTLMNQYKQKTGQPFLGVNPLNLNEEEQKLLEQKIKEEKDVSIKSLLEEINDKNKEMRDLQEKIKEIEALLPVPHIVKAGETHFQIAQDFLVKEKNVDKKQAAELIERTALYDMLVPGFKVYNFYTGDEYGTSVTQGTAPVSPNTIIRQAKKKLVDARDEAISQRDKLSEDIKTLEERRNELIQQLDMLANEKANLINKVSELNVQVNSLFYLVDTESSLKKKGILKGGFLRSTKLRDVSPEHFVTSMDLRTNTELTISASDLGIGKIKSVTLFPKLYKAGADYKVEISTDKQTAILIFLDIGKFKNERLVISIE